MNKKKLLQLRNKTLEILELGKQGLLKKEEEHDFTTKVKIEIINELQAGTLAFRKFEKLAAGPYWRYKYGKYASKDDLKELIEYSNFLEELLQDKNKTGKQVFLEKGDFFKGRVLVRKYLSEVTKSLLFIDNYIDISILEIIGEIIDENPGIDIKILTATPKSKVVLADLKKFIQQYNLVNIKTTQNIHDRYLIVDNVKLIHSGHSFKDLGNKKSTITYIDNAEQVTDEITKFNTEWGNAQDFR